MYVDALLRFDDAAAHLTTEASDNFVDLLAVRNLGDGEALYFYILVDTAFTDSGSDSTMAITLETDDNTSFSSATTAQTIGTFAALSAAGSIFKARLNDQITERYLRVKYTVANGDLTTGNFTCFLTKDVHAWTALADNITIS